MSHRYGGRDFSTEENELIGPLIAEDPGQARA